MHITIIRRILVRLVLRGRGNGLGNNDTNNQSVDAQNTRHDNGDNVTNDTSGVIDTHVTNAQTGTPRPPGRTPRGQNHTNGGAHVTTMWFCRLLLRLLLLSSIIINTKRRKDYVSISTIAKSICGVNQKNIATGFEARRIRVYCCFQKNSPKNKKCRARKEQPHKSE